MSQREWGAGSGTLLECPGPRRGCTGPAIGPLPGGYRSLLPALLLTACGGADAGPIAVERDSAGVHIVENPAALAANPLWAVAPEPALEIGELEGEEAYQLSQVQGAVRLSDGRIVIANQGTQELRFFAATGAHLHSAGREGEGPGEFKGLGSLSVLPGDTLAAYDWNLRRVSFFDPAGRFVRSVALDFPGGFPLPIGRFEDGAWLCSRGFVFAPGNDGSEVVRDTVPFLVFDPTGALRDSIGRFPGAEFYVRSQGRSAFASSLPFGRTTEAVVIGHRFLAAHTDRYEIVRYTPAGVADLVVRLERTAVPVASGDVARFKAERLENAEARFRQQTERNLQEMPFPATFPAFADLMADPDGNLWVLDYSRPGEERRHWTVFSPEGRALGMVETPAGLRILEIGRDYVLGVWQDDLDVEHVRMHRLDRERP
jgi:hypothetical protein